MLTPNQIPIVTVPAEPSSMLVILLKIRNQTAEAISPAALLGNSSLDEDRGDRVKYWEIIADNLKKAGWSWGCVSAIDSNGQTIWIADAHRGDGKRFVVRADEKLTAFLELESAIRAVIS